MNWDNCGSLKTIMLMIYYCLIVALLCINLLFGIFVFKMPVYVFNKLEIISTSIFFLLRILFANWTNLIATIITRVLLGSNIHIYNIDLSFEAKLAGYLILVNQGSCIDWIVDMFGGHMMNENLV